MENYTGKRLDGRYEIEEIIGIGGMAVVYKAYDTIDDRIVAVKILKDEFLANEEFRRRFKNESKAIAVLSHPNIVKVYDVSYREQIQYIVMEYVEGITLKEYINQQGIINTREAVFFTIQVLRALQHAHDKGIVHRDIKPQNILLLKNGAIKVTDFGIARFSASETKTMTNSTIGSVHYISPEQARGDYTDDKTDIYSVGVMLYEMLTGRVPFESDNTVSIAIMQLQKDPEKPKSINNSIPLGLEQIVLKAMQKNSVNRYNSAAEMILDLEEFKRNSSVVFNYNYENNEPTKYIPQVSDLESEVEDINEDSEVSPKNKTIPILLCILITLAIVLGVGFYLLYHFGILFTKSDEVTVPDFVGQIYSESYFNEHYKDYVFDVEEELNPALPPNQVIRQNPDSGQKFNPKKDKINLIIAANTEMVAIPEDLRGKNYVEVTSELAELGLTVKDKELDPLEYKGIDPGTVVKLSPSEGTKVSLDTVITIEYVSYKESEEKLIRVPDVSKLSLNDAKQVLTNMGFSVNLRYDYSDSIKKDYVVSNTLADVKVPIGSSITVTVSKGVMIIRSTNIYFYLPDVDSFGTVSASLDSNVVLTETDVKLNGSRFTVPVSGSEADSIFKISIDNQLVYKCSIDFSSPDCTLSNVVTYTFEPKVDTTTASLPDYATVPDVSGKTADEAKTAFENAGFTSEVKITPSEVTQGVVIGQFPLAKTKMPLDTDITIVLG